VLAQEDGGKEYIIAYLSRRLLDTETREINCQKLSMEDTWKSIILACGRRLEEIMADTLLQVSP
jgi:hypothetical protein